MTPAFYFSSSRLRTDSDHDSWRDHRLLLYTNHLLHLNTTASCTENTEDDDALRRKRTNGVLARAIGRWSICCVPVATIIIKSMLVMLVVQETRRGQWRKENEGINFYPPVTTFMATRRCFVIELRIRIAKVGTGTKDTYHVASVSLSVWSCSLNGRVKKCAIIAHPLPPTRSNQM